MQYILKTEYRGSRTESATCLTVICRPALRPTAMDTSRITMNSAILVAATSRIYWSWGAFRYRAPSATST